MTRLPAATRESILINLHAVRRRIQEACRRAGRDPGEVVLLLATKAVPPDLIRVAVDAGERCIGENKVQEALAKRQALRDLPVEWHFIGHLQTNKVKDVLTFASMIQSVDRIRLVEKLDQQLQRLGRSLDILIQVNTSYEESKFGVAPEETLAFVRQVAHYDTLNIKGLMTIGKLSAHPEDARRCFRLLRQLRDQIAGEGIPRVRMDILSMGMSGDLEIAVEEGSTMVRVGTAVFGPRPQPDSHYWSERAKAR
jgi:pyridoxal phosphate enzyme (YggS family)